MCPHLEPDTIAYRDRAIHRGQLTTYWTPSLMSQFNLAGGVGGCSTSLHYGRMVTFGFCSKSPFISWKKEYGNMGCQVSMGGIQNKIDVWLLGTSKM